MFDGSTAGNITIFMALAEGLISFFSPCVLPLLPIYLGYFSGALEDEKPSRKKTLLFTMTFILGIFTALLLLNVSFTWISGFFKDATVWMMRIGGIVIIILGFIQIGILKIPLLERTFHIHMDFTKQRMNVLLAFVMGFTFSFSWTPCIGPALASILILASHSGSLLLSTGLVLCYAIGFAVPFLIISFFSKEAVQFFRRHDTLMQVIVKVGAVILVLMGVLMFSGNLSILGGGTSIQQGSQTAGSQSSSEERVKAPQFTLKDQNDQEVSLSDFEGKVVFINFWATWCGYCKQELPEIQALYDEFKNSEDVAVITIVAPNMGREVDEQGIKEFIKEKNIQFPILFDQTGEIYGMYGINSFPTCFLINADQTVYGMQAGGLDLNTMKQFIQDTKEGKRYQK